MVDIVTDVLKAFLGYCSVNKLARLGNNKVSGVFRAVPCRAEPHRVRRYATLR
jgi:hypothetical protein